MSTHSQGRESAPGTQDTRGHQPTSSPEPGPTRRARVGTSAGRHRRPQGPGPTPAEIWRDYRAERAAELRLIRRLRHRGASSPIDDQVLRAQHDRVIEARNAIVERYLPTLAHVAQRLKNQLPRFVELGDLASSGVPALMSCVERFRPARNNRFETFALPRLRGGILDTLRSQDPVPRTARTRNKIVELARDRFLKQHGRPPEPAELAELIDAEEGERELILKEKQVPGLVSLDAAGATSKGGRESTSLADQLPTPPGADPLNAVLKRDLKDYITRKLSRRDRLIVVLYYYENMTMKEIAITLEISESRVSQVLKLTLEQLRARLSTRKAELVGRSSTACLGQQA